MKMNTYSLHFEGYWREVNKKYVPRYSGIYLVYTCRYVQENNTVSLSKLIYIGQGENLNMRIAGHNEEEFKKAILEGETLCYACASVDKGDLDIVENGMIFAEQPPCNTDLKDSFNYDDSQFEIDGNCELLKYTNYKITTKEQ